jgi:uncharacterized protein YukJ
VYGPYTSMQLTNQLEMRPLPPNTSGVHNSANTLLDKVFHEPLGINAETEEAFLRITGRSVYHNVVALLKRNQCTMT